MGIVKKLRKNELNGAPTDTTEVYPITLIDAVYDSDGNSLKDILENHSGGNGGGGCNCDDNNHPGGEVTPPIVNPALDVVTVYGHFETDPPKPTGGVYSLAQKKLMSAPTGWKLGISGLTLPIYVCDGVVDGNGTIHWGTPIKIHAETETPTPPIEVEPSAVYISKSIGCAIYKRALENSVVPTPTGGNYTYDTRKLTPPSGWQLSPALAEATRQEGETGTYCIWVSYSNYIRVEKDGLLNSAGLTEWSTPVKFLNISDILDRANTNAEKIAEDAVRNGAADLQNALQMLEESGERVAAVVDSINTFYEWQEITYDAERDSANLIATPSGVSSLTTLRANCSTSEYYNKIVKIGDKYYKYSATDIEVLTQVAGFQEELSRLNTTVSSMKPDEIRLQASTGFLDDVTWTEVAEPLKTTIKPLGNTLPTDKYSDTNTSGFKYGEYYEITDSEGKTHYYRCDYPISTGFLQIMSDNIKFGIADTDINGDVHSGDFYMYFGDDGEATAELTAKRIVLNGDVIAKAIAAKELNIDNKTYLFSDGTVKMAMGTSGSSIFNTNGSGQLAGGLISWGQNTGHKYSPVVSENSFAVKVLGHIEALSGYIGNSTSGWEIANTASDGCHMIGTDGSGNYIYLNPTKGISQHNRTLDDDAWNLQLDGSGRIAYGPIWWNKKEQNDEQDWYLYFGQQAVGDGNHLVAAKINARDGSGYIGLGNIAWTAAGVTIGPSDDQGNPIASYISANGSGWTALHNIYWERNGFLHIGGDNEYIEYNPADEGTLTINTKKIDVGTDPANIMFGDVSLLDLLGAGGANVNGVTGYIEVFNISGEVKYATFQQGLFAGLVNTKPTN